MSPFLTSVFLSIIYGFKYFILVQSLLSDPNPASPANAEASQLYERDRGYVYHVSHSTARTNISLNLRFTLYHDDVVDV